MMFFARHTPANLSQLRLMLDIWVGLCLTEKINRIERENMIEKIDANGDLWRLHYACHGCPPVNFYDTVYGVVIESGEAPEFCGDIGTVNGKHKVDNLNLVWCVTEKE